MTNNNLNKQSKMLNKVPGMNKLKTLLPFGKKAMNTNASMNNKALNNASSQKGTGNIVIIVAVVLLLVILGVFGYFLYKYFQKKQEYVQSKMIIPYIHDGQTAKSFTNSSMPTSTSGNEYNINVWIYVSDYNHRLMKDKCVLFIGDISEQDFTDETGSDHAINNQANPGIWLLKNTNTLRINTGLETTYKVDEGANCNNQGGKDHCDIENFPLQKWVCLNVSLRNNVLDVFMNGTLVKSCILSGFPITSAGKLFVCQNNGFSGYLSNLEVSNKALSYDAINSRYKKGPSVNL